MLIPSGPENYVEGPGTVGEGTLLATSGGAECGDTCKLTLPTANSGAGIGTEGACPHSLPELNQGDRTH
ncbi:hypothetical protein E2C01_040009 [Portunus trituberculatus]|uniref:Uncharacterized protein n=1 Tax=Portunus trituberculatus TaxID=210409 RepID=A0A5B7FMF3_PORTR|nr:hypothetical protein [Portunus trituberculatus]